MTSTGSLCYHIRFGLIVTGVGEEKYLPRLFSSLTASGICSFKVIRRIGQRDPITSKKHKLKMIGTGKTLPNKDVAEIGLPARQFLDKQKCGFLILIDDLEYGRLEFAQEVYDRYKKVFEQILAPEVRHRASVHFLVNMLEAYYFAHSEAVNTILHLTPPLQDFNGDVETIRHPKNELKALCPAFNEVCDGGKILNNLDVEYILAKPDSCASLRTLFAWCVAVLTKYYINLQYCKSMSWEEKYKIDAGRYFEITKPQLDAFSPD